MNLDKLCETYPELLHFSDLDASVYSWLKQAIEYKNQGKFKIALQFYEIAKEEADILDIYDCYIGIAEEERDYETAIKYAILKNSVLENTRFQNDSVIGQIQRYSEQLDKKSNMKKLAQFILFQKTTIDIAEIIEHEFFDFEESERDAISNYFISCLELAMMEHFDHNRIPEFREKVKRNNDRT